jgi:archaetidylinositol phosphate synthase
MSQSGSARQTHGPGIQRPWDARLARKLITPLKDSWVTPNYLTSVRLGVGLAAAAAFLPGTYGWSNLAALLLILSNFLDHTDGELARISGKSSRIGHVYDLASDAVVTVLLFFAMGVGVGAKRGLLLGLPPAALGMVGGVAVALIFWLRLRIEDLGGKAASRQASMGGFETEDVLYLLPLVTICNGVASFVVAASIGAPLFALWVIFDYRRLLRRRPQPAEHRPVGAA